MKQAKSVEDDDEVLAELKKKQAELKTVVRREGVRGREGGKEGREGREGGREGRVA